jgi:hypothetical protein
LAAFLGDRNGDLFNQLESFGVAFTPIGGSEKARILFVDGEALTPEAANRAKAGFDAFLAKGGTAWVMLRSQKAATGALNILLGPALTATNHPATSLVRQGQSWLSTLGLDRLYFAEEGSDTQVIKCGLDGPLVGRGKVLLRACETDWTKFNNLPEDAKCGASVMYQQLRKPSGAALVEAPLGKGRVIASSIDYLPPSTTYAGLWRDLLGLAGVKLGKARSQWLLPISTATDKGVVWQYTLSRPETGWLDPGFMAWGWSKGQGGFGTGAPGGRPRTHWRTSDIWIRCDFDIEELRPGAIKLMVHHDEDVEVYVNGVEVFKEKGFLVRYEAHTLSPEACKAFRKGRNFVAAHCHQTEGGQYLDLGFLQGNVAQEAAKRPHDLLLDGPIEP